MNQKQRNLNSWDEARIENLLTNGVSKTNNLPTPTERPKLIIKYGPPASGKGSGAVANIIKSLGDPLNSYFNAGVDDIIQNSKYFTNTTRNLVKKILGNNSQQFSAKLNKITQANAKKIGNVYFKMRVNENSLGESAKYKLERALENALVKGKNVTYELTGGKSFHEAVPLALLEMFSKPIAENKYQVVFIFPTLPFEILWQRYKGRAISSYQDGKYFRFASTKQQLRQQYLWSYQNYLNALDKPAFKKWVDMVYVVQDAQQGVIQYKYNPKTLTNRKNTLAMKAHVRSFINQINNPIMNRTPSTNNKEVNRIVNNLINEQVKRS